MLVRKLLLFFNWAEQNEGRGKMFHVFQLEERKNNWVFIGTLSPGYIVDTDGRVEPLSVLLLPNMEPRRSLSLSQRVS